ncbi:Glutathione S-transferase [Gryllus bimaculatus]|nr:Glutathione S-transferase [Gryllus bimaculatus]
MQQHHLFIRYVPFGKIPTLEVDGKTAHQSISICRFLGREFGLAGENNWEGLQIDAVVDTIQDLRIVGSEEARKTTLDRQTSTERNKSRKNKWIRFYLSWEDLYFAAITEFLKGGLEVDFISQYPNLKVLAEKVWNLPRIKAWREKRPKTQF